MPAFGRRNFVRFWKPPSQRADRRCAISTVRDGELGYFQHRFAVYGRENDLCPRKGCEGTIERIVQSGRSSFYCSECQA